jgi:hypothetical protein
MFFEESVLVESVGAVTDTQPVRAMVESANTEVSEINLFIMQRLRLLEEKKILTCQRNIKFLVTKFFFETDN